MGMDSLFALPAKHKILLAKKDRYMVYYTYDLKI